MTTQLQLIIIIIIIIVSVSFHCSEAILLEHTIRPNIKDSIHSSEMSQSATQNFARRSSLCKYRKFSRYTRHTKSPTTVTKLISVNLDARSTAARAQTVPHCPLNLTTNRATYGQQITWPQSKHAPHTAPKTDSFIGTFWQSLVANCTVSQSRTAASEGQPELKCQRHGFCI